MENKVINLFGSPSLNKNLAANYIASCLESFDYKVIKISILYFHERRPRYNAIWQISKQNEAKDKGDFLITTTPLPLIHFYCSTEDSKLFNFIYKNFNKYDNLNFFITTTKSFPPQKEDDIEGDRILDYLDKNNISYVNGINDKVFYDYIVETAIKEKKNGY